MSRTGLEEISKIGFNHPVCVDGRSLHVQTEVLLRDGIKIRTTVLEAGTVRFVESRPCPVGSHDLAEFRGQVEAQHDHYVRLLESNGATWLAST